MTINLIPFAPAITLSTSYQLPCCGLFGLPAWLEADADITALWLERDASTTSHTIFTPTMADPQALRQLKIKTGVVKR